MATTSTKRADELYDAAVANHAAAYEAASQIGDPRARLAAQIDADRVLDLQREYQRKVRHGEER